MLKNLSASALALTLALSTPLAKAQDSSPALGTNGQYGVEVGLSTLGLTLAPTYAINDNITLRGLATFGSLSGDYDLDGNSVSSSISTQSFAVLADYYPTGTGFRLSGGLTSGGYQVTSDVNSITFDGTTFNAPLAITVKEKSAVAPTLSLGFNGNIGRVGFSADLGARVNTLEFSSTGQSALANEADYNNEVARINQEFEDTIRFLPYISFGATFRF